MAEKVKFYLVDNLNGYETLKAQSAADTSHGYLIFYTEGNNKRIWANGMEYVLGSGGANIYWSDDPNYPDKNNIPGLLEGDIYIEVLNAVHENYETSNFDPTTSSNVVSEYPTNDHLRNLNALTAVYVYHNNNWVTLKHSTANTYFDVNFTLNKNTVAAAWDKGGWTEAQLKDGVYKSAGKSVDEVFYDIFTRRYLDKAGLVDPLGTPTITPIVINNPTVDLEITPKDGNNDQVQNGTQVPVGTVISITVADSKGYQTASIDSGSVSGLNYSVGGPHWEDILGTEQINTNSINYSLLSLQVSKQSQITDYEIIGQNNSGYNSYTFDPATTYTKSYNDLEVTPGLNKASFTLTGRYIQLNDSNSVPVYVVYKNGTLQWSLSQDSATGGDDALKFAYFPENDTTKAHGDETIIGINSLIGLVEIVGNSHNSDTKTFTVYGCYPVSTNGKPGLGDTNNGGITSNTLSEIPLNITHTNGNLKSFNVGFGGMTTGTDRKIRLHNSISFGLSNIQYYDDFNRIYKNVTSDQLRADISSVSDGDYNNYTIPFKFEDGPRVLKFNF